MSELARCELCGEPMPPGEEMFKFHGYSGDCPKPWLNPADSKLSHDLTAAPPRPALDGELRAAVMREIDDAMHSAIPEPWDVRDNATDRIMLLFASRITSLSAQLAAKQQIIDEFTTDAYGAANHVASLFAQLAAARRALEWYADADHYRCGINRWSAVELDEGETARRALAADKSVVDYDAPKGDD